MPDDVYFKAKESSPLNDESTKWNLFYNRAKGRYKVNARYGPRNFNGLTYGTPIMWFSAGKQINGSDVLDDNAQISSWGDLSGTNHHAVQDVWTKKPTLKLNILNNRPVVRFDGIDDFLTTYNIPSGHYSYYLIMAPRVASEGYRFSGLQQANNYLYQGTYRDSNGNTFYHAYFASSSLIQGARTFTLNQPYLLTLLGSRSGKAYGYVNGVEVSNVNAGTLSAANTPFLIGMVSSGYYTSWDIGEIVVYNECHSTSTQTAVQVSLASKYGITLG